MRSSRIGVLLRAGILISSCCAQDQPPGRHPPVLDVSSMDASVDPCVDFYAYSCGGWIKKNPIPPDQSSWSVYGALADDNQARLRGILESAAARSGERTAYTGKIGDYYASCVDETTVDALGATPLRGPLETIEKLASKSGIADVVAGLAYQGALFRFRSDQDYKDSTRVIAEADQGGLGLPDRDYYVNQNARSEELRKAYVAHVQKMFELLGDNPGTAVAEAKAVMRIETELARGSMTRVERREPKRLYHKMTVKELEKLSPQFDWSAYFTRSSLPSLRSLNVVAPGFFAEMGRQINEEGLADWKAYLRWHLMHANARFLSSAFVNEDFNFFGRTLEGREQLQPRWKRCVEDTDHDLGEALGQAYVETYFSAQAKQKALAMVTEIEGAMQEDIEALRWMSPDTKKNALKKLRAVKNKIGYPDRWRDYSRLEIRRGDEMGNVERARQFEFNRQLAKIGKPVDPREWGMTPPTVNAEYEPQRNEINFPAGILQPPLFDPSSDGAPNYGDTGATIGHELTHGFDDEGRQFDAHGNLRNWWRKADGKEFEKRASCISDQYSKYVIIDDLKINGKLTLGEDVADLGGLILAYMAWKESTRGQKLAPIDGLTAEQRFFVGYGQSWCGSLRDEEKRLRARVDPHSPDQYRASGVVANMPEFQEAFHCQTGARMAPEERCRVW
ncbi:MAG TPA: M13 family metallopeptidase [Terriglobales bacterium]|nr:M13 family metallopeptidase [Terriglobales bacterium]